jgi:two-component system, OmpR family, response regulator PhoP
VQTKLLLIEDHHEVRQSTAAILRRAGYTVIEAPDGVEALLSLSAEPIDVILLDVALPRLDGITLLETQYSPPPVIVVSALEYFSEEALQVRFGSKVFAFLQKPVAPERLLAVVAEAIAGSAGRWSLDSG